MLQGIQVGPLFISQNPVIWNTILIALLLCNIVMFVVMFYPIKWISKIIFIPKQRLYPVIIIMCVVGAYAINSGVMFDVWSLLLFGIVGYIFNKINIPVSCFLIGFILGRDLESNFMNSIKGSGGSLAIFFTRPIAWVIWALIIASVAYALIDNRKSKKMNNQAA